MLYNLQPDRSVTGGSWYSPDNEYDSEFVEVLNFHCYRLLEQKAEAAKQLPVYLHFFCSEMTVLLHFTYTCVTKKTGRWATYCT